jgi:4-hydroxybenzoate polyprenyltransferase
MPRFSVITFLRRLRLSNPWNYKVPALIAIPYYVILAGGIPFSVAARAIAFSFMTILGIAAFGYFTNDLADREDDRKSGKPNAAEGMSFPGVALVLAAILAAALLPWVVYFPVSPVTGCLLILQFVLFGVYVLPPFRLKERGFAGVATDALYAHVNPAILAACTFSLIAGHDIRRFPAVLVMMGIWQFFQGLRNILFHQLSDLANDRVSGARTFVIINGEERAASLVRRVVIPCEAVSFVAFLALVSDAVPLLLPAYAVYLAFSLLKVSSFSPAVPWTYRERTYLFFDEFVIGWVPVVILLTLCRVDIAMVSLLFLHVGVFRNGLTPLGEKAWSGVRGILWRAAGGLKRH